MNPPPKSTPQQPADLLKDALDHYKSGDLDQAEKICDQILQQHDEHANVFHLLGVIAYQKGHTQRAIHFFEKALKKEPLSVNYHIHLGIALQKKGKLDRAVELFQKAVNLNPELPETHNILGNTFSEQRKWPEAIDCYRNAIRLNPEYVEAYNNVGKLFNSQDQLKEAVDYLNKAIDIDPDFAESHNNLGIVFVKQGKLDDAGDCFKKAIQLLPDYAEAHNNLGIAFEKQGRLAEAGNCFKKALELKPDYTEAHNNLGNVQAKGGHLSNAIDSYNKAILLDENSAEVYSNLGNVLISQGKPEQALRAYETALEIMPDFPQAVSNILLSYHYHTNIKPLSLFNEHKRLAGQLASKIIYETQPHTNERSTDRRLRIGYVSPDFRMHSVAFFMEPLLQIHDRSGFEIFCYANVAEKDGVTERLEKMADTWRNIFGVNDNDLDRMIRKDRIDILVDLAGHTANNRLPVFVRKPAPVQVTYLGYPNTTGLKTMDYRITDIWSDPPGRTDHLYTEKLIRLPESFLCYQPPEVDLEVSKPPALETGYITFGSFNIRSKITPKVVEVWSTILNLMADSRLILKSKSFADKQSRQMLLDMFFQHHVAPERIELFDFLPFSDHLKLYSRVDIALDTFPYNGTTTTCEAMWMGVPVIVLKENCHYSRVGVSLLTNVGIPELICESMENYVEKAVKLGSDLKRLQSLRTHLRSMMVRSPIVNAKGFIYSLEAVFRKIWHLWCMNLFGDYIEENRHDTTSGDVQTNHRSYPSKQAVDLNQHGEALFKAGSIEKAISVFKKLIQIEPNYAVAYNNLGVAYWHSGDMDKAEQWLIKSLSIDPHHRDTVHNLFQVLETLDRYQEAQSIYSTYFKRCYGG